MKQDKILVHLVNLLIKYCNSIWQVKIKSMFKYSTHTFKWATRIMAHWTQGKTCSHTVYTIIGREACLTNHVRKSDPTMPNLV
jgi:hypothetical protein